MIVTLTFLRPVLLPSASGSNKKRSNNTDHLAELIELSHTSGQLYVNESSRVDYIEGKFCETIFKSLYQTFLCELKCGHLESMISLVPRPYVFKGYERDFFNNNMFYKDNEK